MITFGDPKELAIQVSSLKGAPRESDPAAAATWVALELIVKGKNLTAHTHEDLGVFHRGIHWPGIYLARWLVRSWPGLFETARWPVPTLKRNARDVARILDNSIAAIEEDTDETDELLDKRDLFVQQHAMQAAAAGAVLPGIYLARDGLRVSVSWVSPPAADVVFHHQRGEADIAVKAFLDVVRNFVEWIVGELEQLGESPDRAELCAWLRRLDSPEQARDVLLGYAGLTPERWRAVTQNSATTPEEFFALDSAWSRRGAAADPSFSSIAVAFRCCSPSLDTNELIKIRELLLGADPQPRAMARLENMAKSIPAIVGWMHDYEQGYQLAGCVREYLGNQRESLDIEKLFHDLGVPVQEIDLSDPDLDGGSVCDETHGPQVFINRRSLKAGSPWGRRMMLAHELCHLLFDRRHAVPLAVISGPWAPPQIERRANAFAAELLLPLAGIRERLGAAMEATDAQLQQLMSDYQIGMKTCLWHLHNRSRRWNDR